MWTLDPAERDAKLAKEALKKSKSGVKHLQVIVEISCASSPYHLVDCSIEEDIASVVAIPLRKVLLRLVSSFRYDKEILDKEAANSEASQLHEAIKAKQLDSNQVVQIFATGNFFQLKATFERYKEMHGSSIDEDISGVGKDDLVSLMKMVILCIGYPERHFAEAIAFLYGYQNFNCGTWALNRAIITRAEVDMKLIQEVYPTMYKNTLEFGDTSGDYRDFLLTLIGSKF